MMDCPGLKDSLIACRADKLRWNQDVASGQMAAPTIVETASFYLSDPELTPRQVVARVAEYDARGLTAIKVYDPLSSEAYRAAAHESRRRGLRLVGHLPQSVSLAEALAAGQDSFEHAHLLPRSCFEDAAQWQVGALSKLSPTARLSAIIEGYDPQRCEDIVTQLASSSAWYVPTHVTREDDVRAFDEDGSTSKALDYLDPLSRWAWNDDQSALRAAYPDRSGKRALYRYFAHGLQLTGKAHQAGVRILVGTDTIAGGLRYHDELAHLITAGMTPAAALRAATIEVARYAGEGDVAGTIAIGKRADLVLLAHNPLTSIAQSRSVRAVIQNGRLYDQGKLRNLDTFARNQARAPHNWAKLLWGFARSSINSEM